MNKGGFPFHHYHNLSFSTRRTWKEKNPRGKIRPGLQNSRRKITDENYNIRCYKKRISATVAASRRVNASSTSFYDFSTQSHSNSPHYYEPLNRVSADGSAFTHAPGCVARNALLSFLEVPSAWPKSAITMSLVNATVLTLNTSSKYLFYFCFAFWWSPNFIGFEIKCLVKTILLWNQCWTWRGNKKLYASSS